MRASVALLIAEEITYDAIGQPIKTEVPREIFCEIASVSMNEFMQAGQIGINAQHKIVTPVMNYGGEKIVELNGTRYGVYRTYCNSDIIEIYLERKGGL